MGNNQKDHSNRNLWSVCTHACHTTHVYDAGNNKNTEVAVLPLLRPVKGKKRGRGTSKGGAMALIGGGGVC